MDSPGKEFPESVDLQAPSCLVTSLVGTDVDDDEEEQKNEDSDQNTPPDLYSDLSTPSPPSSPHTSASVTVAEKPEERTDSENPEETRLRESNNLRKLHHHGKDKRKTHNSRKNKKNRVHNQRGRTRPYRSRPRVHLLHTNNSSSGKTRRKEPISYKDTAAPSSPQQQQPSLVPAPSSRPTTFVRRISPPSSSGSSMTEAGVLNFALPTHTSLHSLPDIELRHVVQQFLQMNCYTASSSASGFVSNNDVYPLSVFELIETASDEVKGKLVPLFSKSPLRKINRWCALSYEASSGYSSDVQYNTSMVSISVKSCEVIDNQVYRLATVFVSHMELFLIEFLSSVFVSIPFMDHCNTHSASHPWLAFRQGQMTRLSARLAEDSQDVLRWSDWQPLLGLVSHRFLHVLHRAVHFLHTLYPSYLPDSILRDMNQFLSPGSLYIPWEVSTVLYPNPFDHHDAHVWSPQVVGWKAIQFFLDELSINDHALSFRQKQYLQGLFVHLLFQFTPLYTLQSEGPELSVDAMRHHWNANVMHHRLDGEFGISKNPSVQYTTRSLMIHSLLSQSLSQQPSSWKQLLHRSILSLANGAPRTDLLLPEGLQSSPSGCDSTQEKKTRTQVRNIKNTFVATNWLMIQSIHKLDEISLRTLRKWIVAWRSLLGELDDPENKDQGDRLASKPIRKTWIELLLGSQDHEKEQEEEKEKGSKKEEARKKKDKKKKKKKKDKKGKKGGDREEEKKKKTSSSLALPELWQRCLESEKLLGYLCFSHWTTLAECATQDLTSYHYQVSTSIQVIIDDTLMPSLLDGIHLDMNALKSSLDCIGRTDEQVVTFVSAASWDMLCVLFEFINAYPTRRESVHVASFQWNKPNYCFPDDGGLLLTTHSRYLLVYMTAEAFSLFMYSEVVRFTASNLVSLQATRTACLTFYCQQQQENNGALDYLQRLWGPTLSEWCRTVQATRYNAGSGGAKRSGEEDMILCRNRPFPHFNRAITTEELAKNLDLQREQRTFYFLTLLIAISAPSLAQANVRSKSSADGDPSKDHVRNFLRGVLELAAILGHHVRVSGHIIAREGESEWKIPLEAWDSHFLDRVRVEAMESDPDLAVTEEGAGVDMKSGTPGSKQIGLFTQSIDRFLDVYKNGEDKDLLGEICSLPFLSHATSLSEASSNWLEWNALPLFIREGVARKLIFVISCLQKKSTSSTEEKSGMKLPIPSLSVSSYWPVLFNLKPQMFFSYIESMSQKQADFKIMSMNTAQILIDSMDKMSRIYRDVWRLVSQVAAVREQTPKEYRSVCSVGQEAHRVMLLASQSNRLTQSSFSATIHYHSYILPKDRLQSETVLDSLVPLQTVSKVRTSMSWQVSNFITQAVEWMYLPNLRPQEQRYTNIFDFFRHRLMRPSSTVREKKGTHHLMSQHLSDSWLRALSEYIEVCMNHGSSKPEDVCARLKIYLPPPDLPLLMWTEKEEKVKFAKQEEEQSRERRDGRLSKKRSYKRKRASPPLRVKEHRKSPSPSTRNEKVTRTFDRPDIKVSIIGGGRGGGTASVIPLAGLSSSSSSPIYLSDSNLKSLKLFPLPASLTSVVNKQKKQWGIRPASAKFPFRTFSVLKRKGSPDGYLDEDDEDGYLTDSGRRVVKKRKSSGGYSSDSGLGIARKVRRKKEDGNGSRSGYSSDSDLRVLV